MKRLILFLSTLMLSCSLLWATDEVHDEVFVSNLTEFIHALRSNRTIVLQGSLEFDNLLERIHNFNPQELPEDDKYDDDRMAAKSDYCFIYHNTDGYELVLAGYHQLTIKSSDPSLRELVRIRPRYAYVFNFMSCSDITLDGLVMGHTDEGYCDGGVVSFEHCRNIVIRNCDLYGCGTEGIGCSDVENLTMQNSKIRDCTYQIMSLGSCRNFEFNRCFFFRNREYSLLNLAACADVRFNECVISHNQGTLFSIQDSEAIVFQQCDIMHPIEDMGFFDNTLFKQCTFSNAYGVK